MKFDWREVRYDSLLALFGLFCLLGSFSPWEASGATFYNALGAWQGKVTFLGSWLIIFAALTEFDMIKEIREYNPYTGTWIGVIGSVLVLVGAITFLFDGSPQASPAWGLHLTIIFGFASLFSAMLNYIDLSEGGRKRRFRDVGGLPSG